ncbi:M81 family metallopeptidase [Alloyangia pacifica]|uniref:M81 family metallopeptidase n=1 Tax=Alloyangia pacifica TaxID=311180 RepID=UPI001CFF1A14|nr:M81 family metallopeptidase [Alloyangia pacifica]
MRIAVTGMSFEALLRSPVSTDHMEWQSPEVMLGKELWMVRGVEERCAEDESIEIVPLGWATALPGGGLTRRVYEEYRDLIMKNLAEAGPIDGIVLCNHGAMEVHDLDAHPDSDFIEHVARIVGREVPIALSLDLHGHVTQGMLDHISALSVLRTAPHRDDQSTGYRATDQLIDILKGAPRQHISRMHLPALFPGEFAITPEEPAKSLYASLEDYDAIDGMVEANLMVGFAWNDRPWVGMSCIAQSSKSAEQAREVATDLARKVWAERKNFRLNMEHATLAAGLDLAAEATEAPLILTDSGDNTTAGAPGRSTLVLQAMLDHPGIDSAVVAGILAPRAVAACMAAGKGAKIELELGAEHLPEDGLTRKVTAIVEDFDDKLDPTGFQPYQRSGAAWARVNIDGIIATLHADAVGVTTPHHFRQMRMTYEDHKLFVVKLGYLHPQLEDACARYIMLLTPGASDINVARLDYQHLPAPSFPKDPDAEWAPEDRFLAQTPERSLV